MALTPEQIEAIRQRTDIVRVVGRYVALTKKGHRYVGLCPFHGEKTPSFSVTAEKGLFYCFGCHAGGDVFAFLMRHTGIDFGTAARQLAQEAGVELAPESKDAQRRRLHEEQLAKVNAYALAFFEHQLREAGGARALAYVQGRGLGDEAVRGWRLGFGGASGALLDYLAAKKVARDLAAQAGLLTEDGQRSLFDGRLIFPILDAQERVLGFGGRRLTDDNTPKYINTRDSALFHKRRVFFGLNQALPAIRRKGRVLLVEGFMDVLACHAANLGEAIAAMGTAFTEEHARACATWVKEVALVLDGDAAGQRATREVAEKLLGAGLKVQAVALPPGEDPDSLVRKAGAGALGECVSRAEPVVEHILHQLFAQGDLSVQQRAERAESLAPLLAALQSGLERDLYTARLAERVGVSAEQMRQRLSEVMRRPAGRRAKASGGAPKLAAGVEAKRKTVQRHEVTELTLLRELFLYPELRQRLPLLFEYIRSDLVRALLEALHRDTASVEHVVQQHLPEPLRRMVLQAPRVGDEEDLRAAAERTFADVLARLQWQHVDAALADVLDELRQVEAAGGATDELLRRKRELSRRKRELRSQEPGTRSPGEGT